MPRNMKDLKQNKVPKDWEKRRKKAIEDPKENLPLDWDIRQKNFLSANWSARNNKKKSEVEIKEKIVEIKERIFEINKERVYTNEALKILGMARSSLMEKKSKGELKKGTHWFYASNKNRAVIIWDIPKIKIG